MIQAGLDIPISELLVIAVTYWRTSVPQEGRASLSEAHFSSSGSFTTTIVVLLLTSKVL
jgi:hypothetical protein